MEQVAIAKIQASTDRQRTELGDIQDLVVSIQKFGQLQPIILDEDFNLVAGFRRLTAHIVMGRDTIGAIFVGRLTTIQSKEMELEENIRRKQLEWQEEQRAIAELHTLKMGEDPLWGLEKTAAMLGRSRRFISNAIELDQAIVEEVPDIVKADTPSGALLRLRKHRQIEGRKAEAKVRAVREDMGLAHRVQAEVICADALAYIKAMPNESVDMAVTNPPFGVDIENLFKGDKTIYADSEQDIVPLITSVAKELYRVLRGDRWFVIFYPTARLEECKRLLDEAGFTYQKVPCVWYKPNKFVSSLANPYQDFSIQYETFFWARKGKPMLQRVRHGDVFVYDTPDSVDRMHPLQMPVDLWSEIITLGSVGGESILEPFAGSGSCGVAAVRNERNYLGIELSREYTERANVYISEQVIPTSAESAQAEQSDAETFKAVEL